MKEQKEVPSIRTSMLVSLRNAFDNSNHSGNGHDEDKGEGDNSFVFMDQMHQEQEFERFFGDVGEIRNGEIEEQIAEIVFFSTRKNSDKKQIEETTMIRRNISYHR